MLTSKKVGEANRDERAPNPTGEVQLQEVADCCNCCCDDIAALDKRLSELEAKFEATAEETHHPHAHKKK